MPVPIIVLITLSVEIRVPIKERLAEPSRVKTNFVLKIQYSGNQSFEKEIQLSAFDK